MFELIIGGSGSGKSEYAERHILELHKTGCKTQLFYIATMISYGIESALKIQRHREMRKDKGFKTIDCFTNLKSIEISKGSTVLLDCISNLLANEMFQDEKVHDHLISEIMEGVIRLGERCRHVIIVSNDIFSEGGMYEDTTIEYMNSLAKSIMKWRFFLIESQRLYAQYQS